MDTQLLGIASIIMIVTIILLGMVTIIIIRNGTIMPAVCWNKRHVMNARTYTRELQVG